MAKAIHTMIRVLDLDKSIDFYKRAFDLDVAERFDAQCVFLDALASAETRRTLVSAASVDSCDSGHGWMVAPSVAMAKNDVLALTPDLGQPFHRHRCNPLQIALVEDQ